MQSSELGRTPRYEAVALANDEQCREFMLEGVLPAKIRSLYQQDGGKPIRPGCRRMKNRHRRQVMHDRAAGEGVEGMRVALTFMFEIVPVITGGGHSQAAQGQYYLRHPTVIPRLLNGNAPRPATGLGAVGLEFAGNL